MVPAAPARRDALIVLLSLAALLAWDLSGLDLVLSDVFGGPQGFAWRDRWLTGTLLHDAARWPAWGLFALLVANLWRPLPFAAGTSLQERRWWVATTLGCVVLIPLLKHGSATSCPWDLARYGGEVADYVPHWQLWKRDGGPGRCFPSGHASTAFSFLAGAFALRRSAPRAGRLWLAATLLLGALFGLVQVMRGAHYLSHSMWTAWVCWTASALAWHGARLWRGSRSAATPAGWGPAKG